MPSKPLSDTTPDEQLLQNIALGDQQAFVRLFRRRRSEVYRFALHMTGIPATAEDVTQEVFMVVMREANRFDATRATVVAWLLGITRNHVLRRLDQDRPLHPLGDTQDLQRTMDAATAVDPFADLARAERLDALRRAIRSLPVRYREVIVLCDLQEMQYADAAAALGCAIGTVRSRLHRARALLTAKMRGKREDTERVKVAGTRCFA